MNKTNPSDIPATLKFQKEVIKFQEEYKKAIIEKCHPDKEKLNLPLLLGMFFEEKCEIIYQHKVHNLCKEIIEENRNSSKINLIENKRFKELVWDALFKTHKFLEP